MIGVGRSCSRSSMITIDDGSCRSWSFGSETARDLVATHISINLAASTRRALAATSYAPTGTGEEPRHAST